MQIKGAFTDKRCATKIIMYVNAKGFRKFLRDRLNSKLQKIVACRLLRFGKRTFKLYQSGLSMHLSFLSRDFPNTSLDN